MQSQKLFFYLLTNTVQYQSNVMVGSFIGGTDRRNRAQDSM
jgi:hypothetical protein